MTVQTCTGGSTIQDLGIFGKILRVEGLSQAQIRLIVSKRNQKSEISWREQTPIKLKLHLNVNVKIWQWGQPNFFHYEKLSEKR